MKLHVLIIIIIICNNTFFFFWIARFSFSSGSCVQSLTYDLAVSVRVFGLIHINVMSWCLEFALNCVNRSHWAKTEGRTEDSRKFDGFIYFLFRFLSLRRKNDVSHLLILIGNLLDHRRIQLIFDFFVIVICVEHVYMSRIVPQ